MEVMLDVTFEFTPKARAVILDITGPCSPTPPGVIPQAGDYVSFHPAPGFLFVVQARFWDFHPAGAKATLLLDLSANPPIRSV